MTIFAVFVLLCGLMVTVHTFEPDSDSNERKLASTSTNFRIIENSTIYIPCYLNFMENVTTIWFRNGQKIADSKDGFTGTPTNVKLETNFTLKISNVKRTDSGEYLCEILHPETEQPIRQSHLVDVLYPPTIFPDPDTGGKDVELLQGFLLSCDVVGNPQPRMKWYFENKEMPLKNEHLIIFNVSRAVKEHAGEYKCVADNAVGSPASTTFQIRILYYPEVTAEKNWVHSAIGLKTELNCKVVANPRAKVEWYYQGAPLNMSSKFSTHVIGKDYILSIKNMRYSDFGNYSCQATNFLGRNYATIEVSGLANSAVFKSDPRKRTENSYSLIWEVDSYSPLIQYNLRFRKQQPRGDIDGHWMSLIIPASSSFMSPMHAETYTVAGLEPATSYEAILISRNEFGWSKPSKIFRFSTIGNGSEHDEILQEVEMKIKKITSDPTISKIEDTTVDVYLQENALWQTDAASTFSHIKIPFIALTVTLSCSFAV